MNSILHIPLFPLGVVLLPHLPMPLHIFEGRYKLMIKECFEQELEFGVVYWKDSGIRRIGCSARITDLLRRYEDGRLDILTMGTQRFLITSLDESRPFLRASVQCFEDDAQKPEVHVLQRSMKALELLSPAARIEKEIEWLSKKMENLKTQEEIRKIQGGNGKMRNWL